MIRSTTYSSGSITAFTKDGCPSFQLSSTFGFELLPILFLIGGLNAFRARKSGAMAYRKNNGLRGVASLIYCAGSYVKGDYESSSALGVNY